MQAMQYHNSSIKSWLTLLVMIPQGSGKTIHKPFNSVFWALKIPKGWDQASINYIQHIYSGAATSNCPKEQHHQGNEFASTIDAHQQLLHNTSGNDVTLVNYADTVRVQEVGHLRTKWPWARIYWPSRLLVCVKLWTSTLSCHMNNGKARNVSWFSSIRWFPT